MKGRRADLPEEVRNYRVDPALLGAHLRDPERTPSTACDAHCCGSGVYVSLPHRDLILRYADAVRACMDPDRASDPTEWFETGVEEDPDFEGGRAVGTTADARGCVFLNGRGLCVLQLASTRNPSLPPLKPFYCRLFPLTVVGGEVTFDNHCQGERVCCSAYRRGGIPVVEACAPELHLVFEGEEVERLRVRAAARRTRRSGARNSR